nr:unnamed protein product [Spirometra erinaceieuropaei]
MFSFSYMFHGGTNFGFWNGGRSGSDAAITTSYDYDAPISEAGDVTTKYMMLRDLLFKLRKETPPPLPSNITKKAYGTVPVRPPALSSKSLLILIMGALF